MATPINAVKFQSTKADGTANAGGKVFTYAAGTTTLQTTYTSVGGSTPNANPVILDGTGRASIYIDGTLSYKFVSQDSTGASVPDGTVDNITDGSLISGLGVVITSTAGAGIVGYRVDVVYPPNSIGWAAKQGVINIGLFPGADPTGAADMTSIMNAAALLSPNLYLPAGTWAMNWAPTAIYRLQGDGKTFIKPFNTATAAITDRCVASQWNYQKEISNLTFIGTALVGVGFTFACTNPNLYTVGDQLMNNVRFSGVSFQGLEKGFQAPSGNIGCEFRGCSWQGNKYGLYLLDNKFSASPMHAGNKYFFGCHLEFNYCGIYIHNTQFGFGGIDFTGMIFENNAIHGYIYATDAFIPVELGGFWNELGGTLSTLGLANVTLDQWTGSVKSATAFPARAFIFDGSNSNYNIKGGRVSDIRLKATNSTINSRGSVCEKDVGVGGKPSTVDDVNSIIRMIDGDTDFGFPNSARCVVTGHPSTRRFTIGSTDAATRWWVAPHRSAIQLAALGGSTVSLSCKITTQRDLGAGTFNVAGAVVADGLLYQTCNEYSAPFTTTSDVTKLLASPVTTTAGWYVATLLAKIISGSPVFSVWDRNTAQMSFAMKPPTTGQWHTLAAMGYSPGGQTLALDCGCDVAGTAVFRLQAYQMIRFDTKAEAQAFLAAGTYLEGGGTYFSAWSPGTITNGSPAGASMFAVGSEMGDLVDVSFTTNLSNAIFTGWVNSPGTIAFSIQNQTGASITPAAGIVYARNRKP